MELRRGTAQRLGVKNVIGGLCKMDPAQFVAQLAELRTQNQQLHQALQQVQQQQTQQQSLIQALSDLPQSLAQTVGSAVLAAANPARTNPTLVDAKGLGKPPPLKNTESEFVSWARRAENFVVSVHPGARVLTWAVEKESATVAEANAATEVVMPPDTLRIAGRSIVHSTDDPCGRRNHSTSLWALDLEKVWKLGGVCINVGTS